MNGSSRPGRTPALFACLAVALSGACTADQKGRPARDAQAERPSDANMSDADMGDSDTGDAEGSRAGDDARAEDSSTAPDGATAEAEAEPDGSVALGASMAERDSAYLFDPSKVHTFELFLRHEDLATLDADPTAEVYLPGQLQFEGGLIPDVGIRYKGSVGSFVGCVSGGAFPPSGAKTCVKLGMKVKLNFGTKGTRFFGQKKLQFHAMNLDRSLLRERFAYGLFNEVGVHAPRTAHVRLLVNGELVGVFLLVEVIDDRFMKDRFVDEDDGEGNLYKEVWPVSSDESLYRAGLEESGSEPASVDKMLRFADELATADDTTLPDVVGRWLDLDYMASYIAVDRAIRHDDGPYHWYCGAAPDSGSWRMQREYAGETCGNHNYFWYEEAVRNQLWLIPWDLDLSLPLGGGFTAISSSWDDLEVNCTELLPGSLGSQMPIACDPLLRGLTITLGERVRATLDTLLDGPLSETGIETTLSPWIAQLKPLVKEAHLAHEREHDTARWSAEVENLRLALRTLREAAAASL